jgi:hypothetical protein
MAAGLAAVVTHLALHIGDPGPTGLNELAGAGYARQPVTWTAPASGVSHNVAQVSFTVPAATVLYVGLWAGLTAGTYYGCAPVGAPAYGVAYGDAATDFLSAPAHGLADGDEVIFSAVAGEPLPGSLLAANPYQVLNGTPDTFQVTLGTLAEDVSSDGAAAYQRIVPQVFGTPGALNVPAGGLTLSAALA